MATGIVGLPEGATLKPIQGLPEGAVLKPLGGDTQPPPTSPSMLQKAGSAIKDFGINAITGFGQGAASTGHNIGKMMGLSTTPEEEKNFAEMMTPQNTTQKVFKTGEQVGEFMLPMGAEKKIASLVPQSAAQMIARPALSAISTGAVNKAQGGTFGEGARLGAIGGIAGEGARALAPSIAESALGVRTSQKLHGAEPGKAILEKTSGVRPSTISDQASGEIGTLGGRLESVASRIGAPAGTMNSSVGIVDDAIAKAKAENSPVLPHLMEIRDQLIYERSPEGGFNRYNPLPPPQTGMDIVNARRGMSDLAGNWEREGKGAPSVARNVYGNLTGTLHNASPEAADIDKQLSSLLPAQKRADIVEHAPGIGQRMADRFARPTGGLALPLAAAAAGYGQHGGIGAAVGGGLGLLGMEALNSPTGKMIASRLLDSGVPTRALPAITLQLLKKEEESQK